MWIFGYGSPIWRPGFDYVECETVAITGYVRRFWQGSPDHRGTPAHPGRVVTLVTPDFDDCSHDQPAMTWGVAYRIGRREISAVLDQLDVREVAGYERLEIEARMESGRSMGSVLTYRAGPDNPSYLGPASVGDMVAQMLRAHGSSGSNTDYVVRLSEALIERGIHDPHVTELAERLKLSRP